MGIPSPWQGILQAADGGDNLHTWRLPGVYVKYVTVASSQAVAL
jgi:hypothetical protein